jgi:uncharacterized membrane protein
LRLPAEEHLGAAPPAGALLGYCVAVGSRHPAHPEDDERSATADSSGAAYSVGRVLALSDGVFAIAMTLLVLNIAVPELGPNPRPQGGLEAVVHVLPTIGTFAVSFFLVGMYWMINHRTFQSVRRVDQGLLWLNLAALMLVCLFPFSTSFTMRYSSWARSRSTTGTSCWPASPS